MTEQEMKEEIARLEKENKMLEEKLTKAKEKNKK